VSLIQEALKRQHEDGARNKPAQEPTAATAAPPPPPSQPVAPPVQTSGAPAPSLKIKAPQIAGAGDSAGGPPPLPGAASSGQPLLQQVIEQPAGTAKSKKTVLMVAALVVLLAGIGAVVGLVVVPSLKKKPAPPTGDKPAVGNKDTKSNPAPAVAVPSNSGSQAAPVTAGTDNTAVSATGAATTSAVDNTAIAIATAQPKEPVIWPILTLQGIMGKPPNGAAIINGQIVSVGQEMEGVVLTAVGQDTVTFSYKGESKRIKNGSTTAQ